MSARVVVVGAGAQGSHLALLGRNLEAEWVLVDHDRVEQRNLLAQVHTRMGVGRHKTAALQQLLQGLYGVRVEGRPVRLGADNAEALLAGADLVVDCVDHAPTRQLLQDFAREHELPCLHAGFAAGGQYARVLWDELFTVDGGGEGVAGCADGGQLPFVAWVSAWTAMSVHRFLDQGERVSAHLHPGGVILI